MKGFIYIIRNKNNDRFYLGSTTNFEKRRLHHLQSLKGSYHHNKYLQNAFDKHGEGAFEFRILYESDDIKADEQRELDNLDWSCVYNLSSNSVGGDVVQTHPDRDQIIEKMRATKKALGLKPPNRIKVQIGDKTYDSYKDASNDLDIPVVTIRYRCLSKNVKYRNWNMLGKEKDSSELYSQGDIQGHGVICEGIEFPSYASAARYFDLSLTAVQHRTRSNNFPTWNLKQMPND